MFPKDSKREYVTIRRLGVKYLQGLSRTETIAAPRNARTDEELTERGGYSRYG
jgi:hypothetical protein